MRERVAYMRSVGMSSEQAAAVFARLPQLFGLDVNNNLAPKIRYLVHELGGNVTTLSNYPAYLSLSLTNRCGRRLPKTLTTHYITHQDHSAAPVS